MQDIVKYIPKSKNSLDMPPIILDMVSAYKDAVKDVKEAYGRLEVAQAVLNQEFKSEHFSTLPEGIYNNHVSDMVVEKIKRRAWIRLVDLIGAKNLMSEKRRNEFDNKFYSSNYGKSYAVEDFSAENVFQFLMDISTGANQILNESIQEVYEWLRPAVYQSDKYKTNQKNAKFYLGDKVILKSFLSENKYSEKFSVYGYFADRLNQIDRLFHILDGAEIPKGYGMPLYCAIHEATVNNNKIETDYFKATLYQNRNIHLEFKRIDLVKELNKIAGGGSLKG